MSTPPLVRYQVRTGRTWSDGPTVSTDRTEKIRKLLTARGRVEGKAWRFRPAT